METLMTQAAAQNNTEGSSQQQSAAPEAQAPEATQQQPAVSQESSTLLDGAEKPTEAKTVEGEQPKAEDKGAEDAPKELSDFTLPEGLQADKEAVEEFKSLAKELGLQQENAQKVADIGFKLAQKWEAKQAEQIKAVRESWTDASKTDKEFGGDKLQENLAVAKKALDSFGSPELSKLLNESGLGSHPEIIRAFYRAGKAISEDKFVPGGATLPTTSKDPAEVLYGKK